MERIPNPTASAPRPFERVRLVTMQPAGYVHSAAFAELVDGLDAAFAQLGSEVDTAVNALLPAPAINFVFGAHLLGPDEPLPSNCVIVNLEQMRGGFFAQPHYVGLLKRHPVIDYSARNVARVRELTGNPQVRLLQLGYVPVLTRIRETSVQDVDVLFYGAVNERRKAILDGLAAAGLRVGVVPFGVYGAERDAWIARSKVVLNVHFYEDKIHELVRSSYLLANRKAVVSECEPDTEIDDAIREALVAVPYAELVGACVALVRDEARRKELERRGFDRFSRRDQTPLLAALLQELAPALPNRINLGSGKDFDPDRLNVDIDPKWHPDVVGNIAAPAGLRQIFFSRRFGLVRLDPEQFDEISAIDVLEHERDLVALMTRCLELLRIGGTMRILVPYDLAWGAWQDPTHVRAFNERSWLYYTEWHWYLGWIDARYDVQEMTLQLSAIGKQLAARGLAEDEVLRTPRAVDAMHVVLRKRTCTEAERQQARIYLEGRSARA